VRSLPRALLSALLLAGLAGTGAAHDDAWMDRQRAPNGGMLRMAGALHLELVRTPAVVVYVTNHAGQAQDTAGAEGTLAVERDGARQEVRLQPAGTNGLKPAAPLTLTADEAVVLFVKLAGQQAETARFVPSKPGAAAPAAPTPARDSLDHSAHH